MPYRRLPNTDLARVRALQAALTFGSNLNISDLAFSLVSLQELQFFLPHFQMDINNQRLALSSQSSRNKEYLELARKARLYVYHFFKIVNYAIARREFKPEIRKFYGLNVNTLTVPSLIKDSSLIKWGKILIEGERERLSRGGNPIYCPSIAVVRVHYDKFAYAYENQKVLKNNTNRFSKHVALRRNHADKLILNIWNEIEANFKKLPDDKRREQCLKYGVVYVWRKTEQIHVS